MNLTQIEHFREREIDQIPYYTGELMAERKRRIPSAGHETIFLFHDISEKKPCPDLGQKVKIS